MRPKPIWLNMASLIRVVRISEEPQQHAAMASQDQETFFIGPDGTIKSYVLKQIVSDAELNQYLDTIRTK